MLRPVFTAIIFLSLCGCSLLNPGYLSSKPDLNELEIDKTTYFDATSRHGQPAITRIAFGKSVEGVWWYKTPHAEVDRLGMISGSYSQNCRKCGRLTLGFALNPEAPTDLDAGILKTIDNKSPSLKKDYIKGEKALCKGDFQKAHRIMTALAEKHYTQAQHTLGVMYSKGDGTKKNLETAYDLFVQAARKGHTGALYDIGVMFENGEYVDQNLKGAVAFFRRAADKGNDDAARSLARILDRMGKTDKAEKYRDMIRNNPDPEFIETCKIKNTKT